VPAGLSTCKTGTRREALTMASFTIPGIQDNDEGWGPSAAQGEGVIYAPFSKGDKVGKCVDFYQAMQRGFTQSMYPTT